MLDEVQELAAEATNRPLIAALRTSLDKRRDGLAVVFTGSNRDALSAMFSGKQAPEGRTFDQALEWIVPEFQECAAHGKRHNGPSGATRTEFAPSR